MSSTERSEESGQRIVCVDADSAIENAGGLGKFQAVVFGIIIMGMTSGAFILYSISYFEKMPALRCQEIQGLPQYTPCNQTEACSL